jgi:hypothetical protein
VTETTQADRPTQPGTALSRWFKLRGRRLIALVLLLVVIVGAYVIGLETSRRDLADSKQLIQQLQSESQRLKNQIVEQQAQIIGLQSTVSLMRDTLNRIMPSENTYELRANQSLITLNGRITVGLVGPPTNQNITVNINGKQQTVSPGDVIDVPPDCKVRIQNFDMFTAIVTTTCGPDKK